MSPSGLKDRQEPFKNIQIAVLAYYGRNHISAPSVLLLLLLHRGDDEAADEEGEEAGEEGQEGAPVQHHLCDVVLGDEHQRACGSRWPKHAVSCTESRNVLLLRHKPSAAQSMRPAALTR